MNDSPIIQSNPQIMSGTPVFAGTRVQVKVLWDNLKANKPLDEFLDHFPSVTRQQALTALTRAKEKLITDAYPLG